MELSVTTPGKSSKDTIQVSPATFGREFNESLVHQVVVAQMAAARAGTKKQKTRSEVSGSTKKPWRQKGTGRARAGNIRSPIWVAGGRAFAAKPRDFSQKVNKKMYRGAMRAILSELIRQNRLTVVEAFNVEEPKTKLLVGKLKDFGFKDALIVTHDLQETLYLAARNLPKVFVREARYLDPVQLLRHENVIITVDAVRQLEEALA